MRGIAFEIIASDATGLLEQIRSYPEPPKLRHMGKPPPDERPKPKPKSPALARMLKQKGRK